MKIYDEITNEELTSPDLSAGYLYTARRVAEHVPESREVMQGTVTEDDPKGLEHIISGYDVYDDCQLYHRYTEAELAERQQAEIEASTIVLDDATKLSLMLAEIPTEAKPTTPPKLGYGGFCVGTAGRPQRLRNQRPPAVLGGRHDRLYRLLLHRRRQTVHGPAGRRGPGADRYRVVRGGVICIAVRLRPLPLRCPSSARPSQCCPLRSNRAANCCLSAACRT